MVDLTEIFGAVIPSKIPYHACKVRDKFHEVHEAGWLWLPGGCGCNIAGGNTGSKLTSGTRQRIASWPVAPDRE